MRLRWLVYRLSRELFGAIKLLPDFPSNRDLKGIGLTDHVVIAGPLSQRLAYLNTFLHTQPRLDIRSDSSPLGPLDFIIATEVLEHVEPPVSRAFENIVALLKNSGFLLLTVPWVWDGANPLPDLYDWKLDRVDGCWKIINRTLDGRIERFQDLSFDNGPGLSLGWTREHFPHLHEWSIVSGNGGSHLRNQRLDGTWETFQNLSFHGGPELTLEMRIFTKRGLETLMKTAGFHRVEFELHNHLEFGIIFPYSWSRPMIAWKNVR